LFFKRSIVFLTPPVNKYKATITKMVMTEYSCSIGRKKTKTPRAIETGSKIFLTESFIISSC
jgi:hypothetical protein